MSALQGRGRIVAPMPSLPHVRLRRSPSGAPRPSQAKIPDTDVERLIVTRVQVARMLSVSEFTVRRLEKAGALRSFKLTPSPSANVYFRLSDVHAFIDAKAAGE